MSVGDALKHLMSGQADIIRDTAALKRDGTDATHQIEELTQRMGRIELTPSGDQPTTPAPATSQPPSDDARNHSSADVRIASSVSHSSAGTSVTTPALTRSTTISCAMSASLHDLAATIEPKDQNDFRNLIGKYKSSLTKLDAASAAYPPTGNRSLVCKKETLGEFDAPMLASSRWWIVEAWCRIMRRRFPVNKIEQRQHARTREWDTVSETAMTYFFDKVQLYRHAFGTLYTDVALAQEIIAALPVSMRTLLRLPQEEVLLNQVQNALCDWEPTWREANDVPLSKTAFK
ncbi:hypothetical protein CF319_g7890 [Tilletia indica]|nr:hypothetical protein CF319_g7890 [Tilletia indica]KAE8228859.1 hypothetical protein CF326_g6190 [Tilletia indica]